MANLSVDKAKIANAIRLQRAIATTQEQRDLIDEITIQIANDIFGSHSRIARSQFLHRANHRQENIEAVIASLVLENN